MLRWIGANLATGDENGATAANYFSYATSVGSMAATAVGSRGYVTGEAVNYPTNSYVRDVAKDSVAGALWAKTAAAGKCYEFTLPNVAEWEFACMGGNTSAIYSGLANRINKNVTALGWVGAGMSVKEIHMVGEKACNAYGLYDMLGNVCEWVSGLGDLTSGGESGTGASADDPVVNPMGTVTGSSPFKCGACWSTECGGYGLYPSMRHAGRFSGWQSNTDVRTYIGCRFVMPATDNGQWATH